MKTKRILSGLVALAMVSTIAPMGAFAIDQDDVTAGNNTGTMTATYDVTAKYTVTIPAGVTLDSTNAVSKNIEASDVMLESGKKIKVTLNSADHTTSGATFHAQTDKGDSTATYTISKGETAVAVGDVVAEFTENGEQSLTFSKAEGATHAGTHTETLTFGIAVEDAAVAVLGGTWDYATISAIDQNSTFTKDGVTLTTTSDSKSGGNFYDYGTNTFSVSSGKITKIEMISTSASLTDFPGATVVEDGTFYSTQDGRVRDCYKVTWTGNASEVAFKADIYAVEQITFTVE